MRENLETIFPNAGLLFAVNKVSNITPFDVIENMVISEFENSIRKIKSFTGIMNGLSNCRTIRSWKS